MMPFWMTSLTKPTADLQDRLGGGPTDGRALPQTQPVDVELGSGTEVAGQYADCIPNEIHRGGAVSGSAAQTGSQSIRLGCGTSGRSGLSGLFRGVPPSRAGVAAIHIYFPTLAETPATINTADQRAFCRATSESIGTGGVVYLRTDNVEYMEWMPQPLPSDPEFVPAKRRGSEGGDYRFRADFKRAGDSDAIPRVPALEAAEQR